MKRTTNGMFILAMAALLAGGVPRASAQSSPPELIPYQGTLLNQRGSPLTGEFPMTFAFYDADVDGVRLFSDTHNPVGVSEGLYTVLLGSGDLAAGSETDLRNVFRRHDEVYLEVVIDGQPLAPRVRIASQGYALNAGSLGGRAADEFIDTSSGVQVKNGDLTVTGTITATGGITGLPAPGNPNDAATRDYVDTAVAGGGGGGSGSFIQNQTASDQSAGFRINGNGLFNGGEVGIGTTAPTTPLHVVLPGGSSNVARFDRPDGTRCFDFNADPGPPGLEGIFNMEAREAAGGDPMNNSPTLLFRSKYWTGAASDVQDWYQGSEVTSVVPESHWFLALAGSRKLYVLSSGRVGVGRFPTANALEVEGNASKTTATAWLANSDRRIKTDIRGIDDALATIERLRPVRFRYTEDYRAKHPVIRDVDYVNFIAQEYREVFPDSVKESGEDGLLQVDTYNIGPYLVAAVKEMAAENRRLEQTVRSMEERLRALEAKTAGN